MLFLYEYIVIIAETPAIRTVSNGSSIYSVMYAGTGNKITIKRKAAGTESTDKVAAENSDGVSQNAINYISPTQIAYAASPDKKKKVRHYYLYFFFFLFGDMMASFYCKMLFLTFSPRVASKNQGQVPREVREKVADVEMQRQYLVN